MAKTLSASIPSVPATPGRRRRILLSLAGIPILLLLLAWSWRGTEFSLTQVYEGGPRFAEFLDRMLPPDHSMTLLTIAWEGTLITLQIALLGTAMGTIAALALSVLAANNLTPEWVHHPVKVFLAILRSIPVVILALVFVAAVGLGAFPGVLAIALHSVGMLGKLYAEEYETAYKGVWEAMDSTGATWLQKLRFAIWPQVAPQIASLTLFRLEMNIRDSAVLGLVGVAGLGYWLEIYRRSFDYQKVGTLLIVTALIVLAVDQASHQLRKRLT